jgi:hypothetical protein
VLALLPGRWMPEWPSRASGVLFNMFSTSL